MEPQSPQQPNQPKTASQSKPGKKTLAGLVGTIAAAILIVTVPKYEGTKNVGYRDPIGIPTKCMGDTNDVVVGKYYTDSECVASLNTQLIAHAEGVLKCSPELEGHFYQLAAAVDFAYNTGVNAYCGSTVAKRFKAGDLRGACKAINEADDGRPQWVYGTIYVKKLDAKGVPMKDAKGKFIMLPKKIVLNGLVTRRKEDRALCETGLPKFVGIVSTAITTRLQ